MGKKNKRKRKMRKARLKLTKRDGIILTSIFLLLSILILPSVSAAMDDFIYFRTNSSHNAIATAGNFYYCGYPLLPYHKSAESGCGSYTGWACSPSIILGSYTLDLIYSQAPPYVNSYNYSSPIWAYANTSCIYKGYNGTYSDRIFYAWKVKSSAGQFCTIQNRWDYYIYDKNFTTENLPLDNTKSYDRLFELSAICQAPEIPAPTYPDLFRLDFTQKINIILLVLFFIIILILIFYKYLMYASILVIIWGFIFLFSGINLLISFLIIAIGCIFALIFGGKR